MKKILFIPYILITVAFFAGSCGKLREPEFKGLEDLRTNKLGLKNSTLSLRLRYFNPNNTSLKLKNADGKVWIDGNFLGTFFIDSSVQILPRAEFRLPVEIDLEMKNILKNSITAFLKNEVTLKIIGLARVGKAGIFINYPVNYEGKQFLNELVK
jgi:LEA14-like dessication related protein